MPEENIPDIEKEEEDKPNFPASRKESIEEIKAKSEAARQDAKTRHDLSRDTWVTIAGFVLIFILLVGSGIVSWVSDEKSHITSFLHLLSSSIMLIMGYIFGTRNSQ
jgi:predicted membrane channel-forming protein YqfA (hemolysin III family)